ncbi:hypothetical protein BGZ83_009823 [Gryganskiella cystojenkinii]|nr:hypothetical protein BGZ83_009823 [Gryganskiella cystojenkinii]
MSANTDQHSQEDDFENLSNRSFSASSYASSTDNRASPVISQTGPQCTCACTCAAAGHGIDNKSPRNHSNDEIKPVEKGGQGFASSRPYVPVVPQASSVIMTPKNESDKTSKHLCQEGVLLAMQQLRTENRRLERALRQAQLRTSSIFDFDCDHKYISHGRSDTRVPSQSRGCGPSSGSDGTGDHRGQRREERTLRASSSSPSDDISARHIDPDTTTRSLTGGERGGSSGGQLCLDSLEFRLKDNGDGAYYIRIGKGVMTQYGNMEINPTTMTIMMRR